MEYQKFILSSFFALDASGAIFPSGFYMRRALHRFRVALMMSLHTVTCAYGEIFQWKLHCNDIINIHIQQMGMYFRVVITGFIKPNTDVWLLGVCFVD